MSDGETVWTRAGIPRDPYFWTADCVMTQCILSDGPKSAYLDQEQTWWTRWSHRPAAQQWPSPHNVQSSGLGECHVMGAAQTSCTCLGLLVCDFIAIGLLRQAVEGRMFIHTMMGRRLWRGDLGTSPTNFVQMGYTNLCVQGIPVGMSVVIFRHIHKITTSGFWHRHVCPSVCPRRANWLPLNGLL
jgi:hypothetical protein